MCDGEPAVEMPVDECHRLQAAARQSDTIIENAMIAATAKVHGLTVVTRNTGDFKSFGVPLFNPFKSAQK